MQPFLSKKVEDKSIVWFQQPNAYVVFDPIVESIFSKISEGFPLESIEAFCKETIDAPDHAIRDFVSDTARMYHENTNPQGKETPEAPVLQTPTHFSSKKYYNINNALFYIEYETEFLESEIHPAIAHLELEVDPIDSEVFHYQLFEQEETLVFLKNKELIGRWSVSEVHVLKGKVSMHVLIDIYKRPEADWMGVFHASAVSNGKDSLLFLGDSGNGKSTSLALLHAHGYPCIADDFVPVDSNQHIRSHPAAISIKKNSVPVLLPHYPELKSSAEFHFKSLNKIVRYLPPKKIAYDLELPCKALIFIKYDANIELEVSPISQVAAFEQLVPDAWISPLANNAQTFLDWFSKLPCYQLTYADTPKMIATVTQIFNDEL